MYGDRPEPVEAATAFVAERFPEARVAFVGGSVLTEHRTPTSDLDVVVVLGEGVVAANGLVAPFRETSEHAGWVVEAFVHTRASIDHYIAQDVARRRPTMMRLCRDTVTLVDLEGAAEEIREAAEAALAAGPPPYDEAELRGGPLRADQPARRHGRERARGRAGLPRQRRRRTRSRRSRWSRAVAGRAAGSRWPASFARPSRISPSGWSTGTVMSSSTATPRSCTGRRSRCCCGSEVRCSPDIEWAGTSCLASLSPWLTCCSRPAGNGRTASRAGTCCSRS